MKTSIDTMPKYLMTDGKITEAKCTATSGAPSSKIDSVALIMVSVLVSLVVDSV